MDTESTHQEEEKLNPRDLVPSDCFKNAASLRYFRDGAMGVAVENLMHRAVSKTEFPSGNPDPKDVEMMIRGEDGDMTSF